VFEDILGPEEEFYDDVIEFEWHGDSVADEPKGPKVLDLSDLIDEKELEEAIDKVIEEALKAIDKYEDELDCCDEEGCDCKPEEDGPFGI
jgi:hypothetical protein